MAGSVPTPRPNPRSHEVATACSRGCQPTEPAPNSAFSHEVAAAAIDGRIRTGPSVSPFAPSGLWTLDSRLSTLDSRLWSLVSGLWSLDSRLSTLNFCSLLRSDCSTIKRTDQLGDTVTFAYDMANRLLQRDYRLKANSPAGPIADSDSFAYDRASRITSATSGRYANTLTQTYDPLGRLESESLTIAGQTYTTTRAYDPRGQLAQLTYPDGTVVERAYTPRGQLQQVKYAGTVVDTRTYDPGGRLSTSTYGNGVVTTWTYRDDGSTKRDNLLDTIATAHPAGVTDTVGDYSYTWDANKNKTSEAITDVLSGAGFQPALYDAEDRLTQWNRTDGNKDQSWNLTPVGDWDLFTEAATTQDRAHGPAHEITGVTIGTNTNTVQHDAKGNVTFIPAALREAGVADDMTLNWDFDNRLSSADIGSDGSIDRQFRYDALGRRVAIHDGTEWHHLVVAGQQLLMVYKTDGTALRRFVYASYIDEPIVLETLGAQPAVYYYHRNQQYSITALTDTAGGVVERYAYDAYGTPTIMDASGVVRATSALSNPFQYTGRYADSTLNLYYFRARYYSPTLGRFLSRDPLGYVDGMSLYRAYFVPGKIDPLGLSFVLVNEATRQYFRRWVDKEGYTTDSSLAIEFPGPPYQDEGSLLRDGETCTISDCQWNGKTYYRKRGNRIRGEELGRVAGPWKNGRQDPLSCLLGSNCGISIWDRTVAIAHAVYEQWDMFLEIECKKTCKWCNKFGNGNVQIVHSTVARKKYTTTAKLRIPGATEVVNTTEVGYGTSFSNEHGTILYPPDFNGPTTYHPPSVSPPTRGRVPGIR